MIDEGKNNQWGRYWPSPENKLLPYNAAIRGKKFLDIGSGKGHIVKEALLLGADAWGVEADPELYGQTMCEDRIFNVDLFNFDFSCFDVLYYYLGGCNREAELLEKIKREFKGDVIMHIS